MKFVYLLLIVCASLANFSALADDARQIADLNPGSTGSFPSNLVVFGESLYFSAYTLETGREFWNTDGTGIDLIADINPTADDIGFGVMEGNDSDPNGFTGLEGILYFSAFDPMRGGELWRYDEINVNRVADISPDQNDTVKIFPNSSWPHEFVTLNDTLYFSANSGTTVQNYELWKYDGVSPQLVANLHPEVGPDYSSFPKGLVTFDGAIYFMADNGTSGFELWRHDGTQTTMFDLNPGGVESSSYPKNFTAFNGHLYFQAFHADSGFELWKTDGTSASLVFDLLPGPSSSSPGEFTVHNGELFFQADDGVSGAELWKFDGVQTTLVTDLNPSGDAFPFHLTPFQNTLLFSATDGSHGWELWKFDGNSVSLVVDLNTTGDSFPEDLIVINDVLYFVATTPAAGYEIWKYDGATVTLAADINPGEGSSFPQFLTPFNGELFFRAADDGISNWELWALTPPPAFTVSLSSPSEGAAFLPSESITFTASVSSAAIISKVEFFAGDSLLVAVTSSPYTAEMTLPIGNYQVTARAIDENGAVAISQPVSIQVVDVSNQMPAVTLTSEQSGLLIPAPGSVTLNATASDPDGLIASVEFFNGADPVGTVTASPFQLTISDLPAGQYSFTAKATDNSGAQAVSEEVVVMIVDPPSMNSITKSGSTIMLNVTGTPGAPLVLEATADFFNWQSIQTNTPNGTSTDFSITPTGPYQFYRISVR